MQPYGTIMLMPLTFHMRRQLRSPSSLKTLQPVQGNIFHWFRGSQAGFPRYQETTTVLTPPLFAPVFFLGRRKSSPQMSRQNKCGRECLRVREVFSTKRSVTARATARNWGFGGFRKSAVGKTGQRHLTVFRDASFGNGGGGTEYPRGVGGSGESQVLQEFRLIPLGKAAIDEPQSLSVAENGNPDQKS